MSSPRRASRTIVQNCNTGDVDFLVGSRSGKIYFYRNIGSRAAPTFSRAPEDPFAAVSVGTYSAPALVDFGGAGYPDLLVGSSFSRGLSVWKSRISYMNINYGSRCTISASDGACSGIGKCLEPQGIYSGVGNSSATATCTCPVTQWSVFAGDQCEQCAAGFAGATCQRCPGNT